MLAPALRFGDQERTDLGGLQPDVVLWTDPHGQRPLRVLGVLGDSLYYASGYDLYRRHLDSDTIDEISAQSGPITAIATDGSELFWTTADCQVSSRRRPYLGGECLASPEYLFIDARHLYLFARTARTWRQPVMTLWKMPRSGGKAQLVAELRDFGSISGRADPLFDGNAFYYVDIYGHVLRLPKDGTNPEPFGEVPTLQSVRLEFTDADAVYWASSRGLVRAPKDGGRQTVVAEGHGSYARAGAVLYQATEDAVYRAAPSGRWERIVRLPSSGSLSSWRLWAALGRLYAYDYHVVLRIDPGGPRTFRVLELEQGDDVGIKSLALDGNDLFYATGDNFETAFQAPDDSRGMSVWSLPKRGGTPRLLFDQVPLAAAPVFDTGTVHYLTQDGTLYRRSLSDPAPSKLLSRTELAAACGPLPAETSSEPGHRLPVSESTFEYATLPTLLAADGSDVFWVDPELAILAKLPKTGGRATLIASDLKPVSALGLDQHHVYLVMHDDRARLVRFSKEAGEASEVLATSPYDALFLATAEQGTVWITPRGGDDGLEGDGAFGLLREAGFVAFGTVPNPAQDRLGWFEAPVCSLALGPDAFYFSRCYRRDDTSAVLRHSFDGADRIIASGFSAPVLVVPAADATYFAEVGRRTMAKGLPLVMDCCSIWVAPR